MSKEERSNYEEVCEHINKSSYYLDNHLNGLDGHIGLLHVLLESENFEKHAKSGIIGGEQFNIKDSLNYIRKYLMDILKSYSYLQLMDQMELSFLLQPNIKTNMTQEELNGTISGLQERISSIDMLKKSYVDTFNELRLTVSEIIQDSTEKLYESGYLDEYWENQDYPESDDEENLDDEEDLDDSDFF